MDKNTMLGKIMTKIVGLSIETLRALYDLIEKISGNEQQKWFKESKKFLRGEKCWTNVDEFFSRSAFSLNIDKCEWPISWNDIDYLDINNDINPGGSSRQTEETVVDVRKIIKLGTILQMFGELSSDIGRLCFTRSQIGKFLSEHKSWIEEGDKEMIFLLESKLRVISVCKIIKYKSSRPRMEFYTFEENITFDDVLTKNQFIIIPI